MGSVPAVSLGQRPNTPWTSHQSITAHPIHSRSHIEGVSNPVKTGDCANSCPSVTPSWKILEATAANGSFYPVVYIDKQFDGRSALLKRTWTKATVTWSWTAKTLWVSVGWNQRTHTDVEQKRSVSGWESNPDPTRCVAMCLIWGHSLDTAWEDICLSISGATQNSMC